jgi:hypothetical protein
LTIYELQASDVGVSGSGLLSPALSSLRREGIYRAWGYADGPSLIVALTETSKKTNENAKIKVN